MSSPSPSPAALRAADKIVGCLLSSRPWTKQDFAERIEAEFAADRAHIAHNMIADVTPIVFKLEQDRAELIEALRALLRDFESEGYRTLEMEKAYMILAKHSKIDSR